MSSHSMKRPHRSGLAHDDKLVLAGDIGGTKCGLALFHGPADAPEVVLERSYPSRDFASLGEVVRQFHTDSGLAATRACFGVAGAVIDGASQLPNLGWRLTETDLTQELGLESVCLINDLEANALGIATLAAEHLFTLNPGHARAAGNQALIAAGTGLGMALLVRDGLAYRVAASEGGHADFAPRNESEVALWRFLAARYGRVSIERVVSGQGLENVYDYLKHTGMPEPVWLAERIKAADDRAAVIARTGLAHDADICVDALAIFLSVYGAVAGNLALTALATGGLYIGGGIAPKLIDAFHDGGFMAAFADKGRFSGLLAEVPVRIILEPKTALRGAAVHALR